MIACPKLPKKLLFSHLGTMERVAVTVLAINLDVGRRDDEMTTRRQNPKAFIQEHVGPRHVLDGLEGNDDVDGHVRKRNVLGVPLAGVDSILCSGVSAGLLGDVYTDHGRGTCRLQRVCPITLPTSYVQNPLAFDMASREPIAVNMLPEQSRVSRLGDHALASEFKDPGLVLHSRSLRFGW
jgi:hypothetical protein